MKRFDRILACTDFSDVGDRAIHMAFGLVHDKNAAVYLVHIIDPPVMPNPMYAHYVSQATWDSDEKDKVIVETRRALEDMVPDEFRTLGAKMELHTPQGQPAEEILRLADELSIQVIVMGTHGRTGLERFLLGSVTERVVRMSQCAVMVIH